MTWKPKAPQGLLRRLRSWTVRTPKIEASEDRKVDLAPWPERIDESGVVVFRDNGRPEYMHMRGEIIKPDIIVFCTGYTHEFSFLEEGKRNSCDYDGNMVRDIWSRDDPSIGFIGFVRPNLGAIPPLAEFQAQLWVLNLLTPERVIGAPLLPRDEPHYRLVSKKHARVRYGVDHESYAYQLALDMGSAPSLGDILRIGYGAEAKEDRSSRSCLWRLPFTWALSANFNTKFRLCGPWRWDGAREVMNTELWDTVSRREIFFGHFTLSIVPMLIFGPMSLLVFIYASLYSLLEELGDVLRAAKVRAFQRIR